MSSSQDSGTHMQRERSNSSLTSGETKYVPKLPSKDGGFKLGSRGRGKWFESEIGRAVKVGSQRMKIRSIGSDPNKSKNDGNIKSKLLVEDVKQQPQPGLGAFFGGGGVGGGGGFNFNAFAATVQSAAGDGSVKSILQPQPQPQPQPPSAPSSGGGGGFAIDQDGTLCGGTNALSQLMSAMGASLGSMPAMPDLPNAMGEQAILSKQAEAEVEPEPETTEPVVLPEVQPFTSLFVKRDSSDSDSDSDSEEEEVEKKKAQDQVQQQQQQQQQVLQVQHKTFSAPPPKSMVNDSSNQLDATEDLGKYRLAFQSNILKRKALIEALANLNAEYENLVGRIRSVGSSGEEAKELHSQLRKLDLLGTTDLETAAMTRQAGQVMKRVKEVEKMGTSNLRRQQPPARSKVQVQVPVPEPVQEINLPDDLEEEILFSGGF